jgi:hypothetical protein
VSYEVQTSEAVPGLSEIVLHVNPSLSPRELADLYREVRRYAVGERHRELSPKHAALALFSVTELRHEPLAARMAEWNRQHPEWHYSRESAFSWDMLQAQRRTLGIVVSSASGARSQKRDQHDDEKEQERQ